MKKNGFDNSYIVVVMYKKYDDNNYNKTTCQVYANDKYTAIARACKFFDTFEEDEIDDCYIESVKEE